jgi:hypothetical protein
VRARIDLAAQDLLGTADSKRGDLLAQRLACLGRLLLGLGMGGGDDLGALLAGAALGLCARRSASARRWAASLRADDSSASIRLLAVTSSALALSAAERPSRIFCARSSRAAVIGGQTNFIVNSARITNTIIWIQKVKVMLTMLARWMFVEAGARPATVLLGLTSAVRRFAPGTDWPWCTRARCQRR